jgi:hypothetical protein
VRRAAIGRAPPTSIVRVVHSLVASTDDWDGQLESTETGWPSPRAAAAAATKEKWREWLVELFPSADGAPPAA